MTGLRVGMDIGGTKTEAVALDTAGEIVARTKIPTVPGPAGLLDGATTVLHELAAITAIPLEQFNSIGVGVPGQIDRKLGTIRNAYNIGISEFALAGSLSERTGLPVALDNDVTAAALGAAHIFGLGGTTAYLNLGTGLAAGIVVDGVPLRGAHGFAGEIGHLPLDPRGRACPCGQRGCLETVASGAALKQHWPGAGEHPGHTLLPAIAAGDHGAQEALDALVHGAAEAIRVLALTVDPDAIIIGGGLRLLGAPLFEGIAARLDAWSAASPFLATLELSGRIRPLPQGSPAAAIGAALATM